MADIGIHGSIIQSSGDTNLRVTNVHATHNTVYPKDAIQILKEHIASGALFDSKERFDPPKCHPDTRTAVLDTLNNWAQSRDSDSKPIMWLRGAAGAGKSAIAQTSAERWEELKILVASFFFSRTASGRNESSYLIPTLAYQLSLAIPSTWPHMEAALLRDICLFEKSLKTQMTELIIRPLAAVASECKGDIGSHVVIIDGLDECCVDLPGQKYEAQQRDILDAITSYSKQANCPLRFLIASRPERQIRNSFSRPPLIASSQTIVLDDTQNPSADIELFLTCRFEAIKVEHPYLARNPPWPPKGAISTLVEKSSDHFIYASTAVRYLERPRQDPRVALEAIMNTTATVNAKDSPFAELDALYLLIMHFVTPESLPIVLSIFEIMCYPSLLQTSILHTVFPGCTVLSPVFLEHYLFLTSGSLTYTHLVDLHSILEIPPEATSQESPIRFFHASFSEFLTNRSRSGSFCVERDAAVTRRLQIWLKHLLIQSLQPDSGRELGYHTSGFSAELLTFLEQERPSPPQGFVEGLTALIGEDERVFAEYVRCANLAHIGPERNYSWLKERLLGDIYRNAQCGVRIILAYLKEHGVSNLKTFLEGYQCRDREIIHPESRLYTPTDNLTFISTPSSNGQNDAASTPRDVHTDEPSATTQTSMDYTHATPAMSRGRTSKKRGREIDSPAPHPPAPSSSQRITRSMASSAATNALHPKVATPTPTAKAPTDGKKERKESAANTEKRRRC